MSASRACVTFRSRTARMTPTAAMAKSPMRWADCFEVPPGAGRQRRKSHLGDHLIVGERRDPRTDEERSGRKHTGTTPACDCDLRVQKQRKQRELGGRIRVRQTPANDTAIADGKVGDMRHGEGHDRDLPRDHRGRLERVMAGERADPQPCAQVPVHVVEPENAVDVDECCGTQQAEVEQWDEVLAAGKGLGVAAVAPECSEGVGEAER